MTEEEEWDAIYEELKRMGVLYEKTHPSGEVRVHMNRELAEILTPEFVPIWDEMARAELDESLIPLVEKGLIEPVYDEDLNVSFRVTPLGAEVMDQMLDDDIARLLDDGGPV